MSFSGLSEKEVTCRKKHYCEWCGEVIEPKEKAVKRAYIWEGEFISSYQHPECFHAMQESSDDICDYGFDQGSMYRGRTYEDSVYNQ